MGSGNLSGAKGNSHQGLNAHFASLAPSLLNPSSLARLIWLREASPRPESKQQNKGVNKDPSSSSGTPAGHQTPRRRHTSVLSGHLPGREGRFTRSSTHGGHLSVVLMFSECLFL